MIVIFLLLATLLFGYITIISSDKNSDLEIPFGVLAIVCGIILIVIIIIIPIETYFNYVETKVFYENTREQYSSAVTMYEDQKVLEISGVYTDLVNQGYQDNIAEFITELRNQIVQYNKTLGSNRVWKNNWLFSWIIIAPDENITTIRLIQ